jgi:hypothetical protein
MLALRAATDVIIRKIEEPEGRGTAEGLSRADCLSNNAFERSLRVLPLEGRHGSQAQTAASSCPVNQLA